jgi:hypothetical protein
LESADNQKGRKTEANLGVGLRGWWATESDGDTSQMPYVPNGMKGLLLLLLWVFAMCRSGLHYQHLGEYPASLSRVNFI